MKRKAEKVEVCPIPPPMLLDYWETSDARQGGAIDRIDEKGMCVHSHVSMPVGRELPMRIFFSPGGLSMDSKCWSRSWAKTSAVKKVGRHTTMNFNFFNFLTEDTRNWQISSRFGNYGTTEFEQIHSSMGRSTLGRRWRSHRGLSYSRAPGKGRTFF